MILDEIKKMLVLLDKSIIIQTNDKNNLLSSFPWAMIYKIIIIIIIIIIVI